MIPKVGDRIELIYMPDDPCPIEPGTTGTVTRVGEMLMYGPKPCRQVSVDWDAPRSLTLCIPPDQIRVISES